MFGGVEIARFNRECAAVSFASLRSVALGEVERSKTNLRPGHRGLWQGLRSVITRSRHGVEGADQVASILPQSGQTRKGMETGFCAEHGVKTLLSFSNVAKCETNIEQG